MLPLLPNLAALPGYLYPVCGADGPAWPVCIASYNADVVKCTVNKLTQELPLLPNLTTLIRTTNKILNSSLVTISEMFVL